MGASILTSFNEVRCSLSLGLKPVSVLVSVSWKSLRGLSSTFMSSLVKMFSPLPALLKTPICIFIALIICLDVFLQRQWPLLRVLKGTVHPTLTFQAFVSELLGEWKASGTGANMNLMAVLEVRFVLCGCFESSLVVARVALTQTEPLLYLKCCCLASLAFY